MGRIGVKEKKVECFSPFEWLRVVQAESRCKKGNHRVSHAVQSNTNQARHASGGFISESEENDVNHIKDDVFRTKVKCHSLFHHGNSPR